MNNVTFFSVGTMMVILTRFLKPLMNQRGAVGDTPPADGLERDDQGFIKGTTFKNAADLAKGFIDTKADHGKLTNELGNLKKDHDGLKSQTEAMATLIKEGMGKGVQPVDKPTEAPDYNKEISEVQKQLDELDPLDKEFSKKNSQLVNKLTDLKAENVKAQVMDKAGSLFKTELTARDQAASKAKFIKDNPTFADPQMQARIKEYIAKDETGMHDPLSAFFQIQRDDANTELAAEKQRSIEMQKILDLQKGKDSTGKVVVKGQSTGQPVKEGKLTGKDLKGGMAEALRKARDAEA